MPTGEDFAAWEAANRARAALEEVAVRRAHNVKAKDEVSAVKMSYIGNIPEGFQRHVMSQRPVPPVLSQEEKQNMLKVAQRRSFCQEARRVFAIADKDNSLALDVSEVRDMCSSEDMAEYMIQQFDGDGDGKLSLAEWLQWVSSQWERSPRAGTRILKIAEERLMKRAFEVEVAAVFQLADSDGSGCLEMPELLDLLHDEMGETTSEEVMSLAMLDADGDGRISEEEWHEFMVYVYNEMSPEVAVMILDHYAHRLELRRVENEFLAVVEQIFTALDKDKSGTLDPREISSYLTPDEQLTAEKAEAAWKLATHFIAKLDSDESGALDMAEWKAFMLQKFRTSRVNAERFTGALLKVMSSRATKERVMSDAEEIFLAYDADNSGGLVIKEIALMLDGNAQLAQSVKEQAALAFIAEMDTDRSGVIELPEWKVFIETAYRTTPEQVLAFIKQLRANMRMMNRMKQ